MAKDTRYLKNLSVPYQITDEKYTDVGSGELTLGDQKRAFKGSADFVVRTASGGGGTLLVEGTDYNLINSDSALTTEAGYTVYTGWQVINATYQSGDLYVTYKTVGTYTGASIINSIIDGWIDINDTLSYASATTISTVYDLTAILEPGMKLKITQPTDGDKYFIIYAITSSLITVTLGDYDLDNEAITSPMFSHSETPFGWPIDDPADGWEVIDDTLTYASATTITTASDLTGFIEPGMKLKITQPTDGVKYFVVISITSSLITISTGTYDLDNEEITSPYYSMSATPFGWPYVNEMYVKVSDVKASATNGGTSTGSTWNQRDINTEDYDPYGICSIASNLITLVPGTYRCNIKAPAYNAGQHKLRLYDTTGSSVLITGGNAAANPSNNIETHAFLSGSFTIIVESDLRIDHYISNGVVTDGFGTDVSEGDEIYTVAEFWKIN